MNANKEKENCVQNLNSIQDTIFFAVTNVRARFVNKLMAKTYGTPNAITAKSIKNTNKGNIELCVISQTKKYVQGCNVAAITIKEETSRRHEKIYKKSRNLESFLVGLSCDFVC